MFGYEINNVDEAIFICGAKVKHAILWIWCNLMCYANAFYKNPACQIQNLYRDCFFLTQDTLGFLKMAKDNEGFFQVIIVGIYL